MRDIKSGLLNFSESVLCMNQEKKLSVFIQLLLALKFAQYILLFSECAHLVRDVSSSPR